MRLTRTELILEEIDASLSEEFSEALPTYVAQFAAIQFCAEMQAQIRLIVIGSAKSKFPIAEEFCGNSYDKIFRSVKKSEISGLIGSFSKQLKDHFNDLIDDQTSSVYNKVVLARHNIAHGKISDITPEDIRAGITAAESILSAVEDTMLNLDTEPVIDL